MGKRFFELCIILIGLALTFFMWRFENCAGPRDTRPRPGIVIHRCVWGPCQPVTRIAKPIR